MLDFCYLSDFSSPLVCLESSLFTHERLHKVIKFYPLQVCKAIKFLNTLRLFPGTLVKKAVTDVLYHGI